MLAVWRSKWIACVLVGLVAGLARMVAFSAPTVHKGTRIGILVVGNKRDVATIERGGALMAKLHDMRQRKGYPNQQLGLFIWDYYSSMEVAVTARRFGITPQDLVFAGVVRVGPGNQPLAVLSRHIRVQDVDAVAQAVFAEAEAAMGVVRTTPTAPPQPTARPEQPTSSSAATPPSASPQSGAGTVYLPRSTQNNIFAVTVTNVETVASIKDYRPRPEYRFIIVYLSQQNVSNEVQLHTGSFSLLDQNNRSFDYIEGLSNFRLVILRPYEINLGYLVFELPVDAHPTRLALHALNQAPLTLNL